MSAILVSIFTLGPGVYFILRSQPADRLFGLFWFSIAFWTCFVGMQFQFLDWMPDYIWGWFLHVGCISVPVLFCHFAFRAANPGQNRSILLTMTYAAAITFILLNTFTNLFTQEIIYRDYYAYPKPAVLYPLYILFFQATGLWSIFLILKWRKQLPAKSYKILYLFLALHLLAYIGSMDNFFIMYDIRIFPLFPYGLYLILPYAFLGSYAVSKLPALGTNTTRV